MPSPSPPRRGRLSSLAVYSPLQPVHDRECVCIDGTRLTYTHQPPPSRSGEHSLACHSDYLPSFCRLSLPYPPHEFSSRLQSPERSRNLKAKATSLCAYK